LAGNQGNHQTFDPSLIPNFHGDEAKKKESKMADSKKLSFSKSPILKIFLRKFHGLVLGLVELIDAKGIDVAQPIWLRDCQMYTQKQAKNAFFVFFACF
jgi:hypothetical protein